MPGERHVFDSLFAGVTNQRERQTVARAAKFICARAFAAFRSFAARLLDGDSITGDCIGSPDVALRINDVERTVGLHRPDGSERVGPRADKRPWRSGRISRASIQEQEKNTCESNSERGSYFHVFSLSGRQVEVKLRSRRRQFAKSF
jgi:hypothetical protein